MRLKHENNSDIPPYFYVVESKNKLKGYFKLRDLLNVSVKTVDLFNIEKEELLSLGQATKWLIDPPRVGALNLINLINDEIKPKLIIYISCNPATLARDSDILVNKKKYTFKEGGIVNMFPHTSHIESIAVFEVNE